MNRNTPHIDTVKAEFRSGIEGVLSTLSRLSDSVVVASDFLTGGFSIRRERLFDNVQFFDRSERALSYAIGLAMTGRRTSVVLDMSALEGARDQLQSALLKQLPLTVVLAQKDGAASDPIDEFGDLGCPLLCASDPQSLMDLGVIAYAVAQTAMLPVLVIVRSWQSLWTYSELIDPPLLDDLPVGTALGLYRNEIWGQDNCGDHAWIATSNPMASGVRTTGDISVKRSIGRRVFIQNELPDLIDSAMYAFSSLSGRTYCAVQTSTRRVTDTVMVISGTSTKTIEQPENFSTVHLTRVRPLPVNDLQALLAKAHAVGVLNESALVSDIQGIVGTVEQKERRKVWKRPAENARSHPVVVPILHSPGWIPNVADIQALATRLSRPGLTDDPVLVGVRLHGQDARLPAIEEIVQRMKRSGISFAGFEASSNEEPCSDIFVIAESALTMWPLMQGVCERLAQGNAQNISGSLHPASGAAEYPVVGRVSFDFETGGRDPIFPVVISSEANLLLSLPVRSLMPRGATVLSVSGETDTWPYWMSEKGLELGLISPQESPSSESEALLNAFSSLHPALRGQWDESIQRVEADRFEKADHDPPETAPGAELLDRAQSSLPVANLLRFWQTLGHLYRTADMSHAPVDAYLTSHFLPASTAALMGRGLNRSHIPAIIAERCSGCGSCWSVCPESAIIVRPFSVEDIWKAALNLSSLAFVHLPRVAPAVLKTAHRLVKADELHQYMTLGALFSEAFERVFDKASLEGDKRRAMEAERDAFLHPISSIRPIRTESWFDARESESAGDGALLGIGIDPDACTSCALCMSACPEDAFDLEESADLVQEWRQLAALQTLPGESRPSQYFDHPAAVLTGRTSRRVFKGGGADRSNLNKTALRLFLEALNDSTSEIRANILEETSEMISRIDVRLQETIDETVRVNDFDQFSRQLSNSSENLFGDPTDRIKDQLSLLAGCRTALTTEISRLESQARDIQRPHMVLVDATRQRNLGLAAYPSNPFAMPYFRTRVEEVSTLLSGITRGFVDQYSELGRQLRIARQVLDDVLDTETMDMILTEDVEWAKSVLPHLALVTDHIDFSTLESLEIGPHVRILALSGAGPSDSGLDAGKLVDLLDNVWLSKLTVSDPVRLLSEFCAGMTGAHPALFQVYAPDPVRDGIRSVLALTTADLAERSGIFPTFNKKPGQGISTAQNRGKSNTTAADWMILQARYAHLFTFISRGDWSADQVAIADWIRLPHDQRAVTQTYVEASDGRYRPVGEILEIALLLAPRSDEPPPQEEVSPEAAVPLIESPRETSLSLDALSVLTSKLLSMSGYEGAIETLSDWKDNQDEVTPE